MNEFRIANLLTKEQRGWVERPEFNDDRYYDKCMDWRNYVPETFQDIWQTLSVETRWAIIIMAIQLTEKENWDW